MIAQVNKQNTAVIADPMHPAGQANGLADLRSGQRGAAVGAIGMHGARFLQGVCECRAGTQFYTYEVKGHRSFWLKTQRLRITLDADVRCSTPIQITEIPLAL